MDTTTIEVDRDGKDVVISVKARTENMVWRVSRRGAGVLAATIAAAAREDEDFTYQFTLKGDFEVGK